MTNYNIKCVAVGVRTESGICPGSAKCQKDETYTFTARTPEPKGSVHGIRNYTPHGICHAMDRRDAMGESGPC